MSVFSLPDFADHEQVVFCSDDASGLKAIIAVHNSNLGPALGGCRMWHYATEDDAIRDVLRYLVAAVDLPPEVSRVLENLADHVLHALYPDERPTPGRRRRLSRRS